MPPETNVAQRQLQQSLMQADQLLWKRRSRASLRRHQDIRNMAVRELFDTERTFVESLDYLAKVPSMFIYNCVFKYDYLEIYAATETTSRVHTY